MIADLRSQIIDTLQTDAIKDMVDTWEVSSTTYYAIFAGRMIPESYQEFNNTILVYHTSPQGSGDIRPINFTVNCRQSTSHDALTLADLVYDELNRTFHSITDGKLYMQAIIQPVIYEDDNCWNCPVEINVRNNIGV